MPAFNSFVNGSFVAQSPNFDNEETINWYIEQAQSRGSKSSGALLPTPGFEQKVEVDEGPIRGFYALPDPDSVTGLERVFFVAGFVLYELFENFSVINRGVVGQDDNPCTFSSNGDAGHQLVVTSGGNLHLLDLVTNVFTADVLTGATMVGLIDGFFVVLDATTSTLKVSAQLDGSTWDPLLHAQRTSGADRWRALLISRLQAWLPGSLTSEVWYDAGTFPFPLAPIPDAFFQQGIAAPFSIATLSSGSDESIVWLSQTSRGTGKVVMTNGVALQEISNQALEFAINEYARTSRIDDAKGFSYDLNGHAFYVLTFPTAQATWQYDITNGLWTKWQFWNAATSEWEASRAASHVHGFGQHLVGDRSLGIIYRIGSDLQFDVGGAMIRRLRRSPHVTNEHMITIYQKLVLDMDNGIGALTGQGVDPTVMLRWSDDGGRTWNPEVTCSAGAMGQFSRYVIFRQLGSARDRVFEISVSDPVPWRISAAYLDTLQGTN